MMSISCNLEYNVKLSRFSGETDILLGIFNGKVTALILHLYFRNLKFGFINNLIALKIKSINHVIKNF